MAQRNITIYTSDLSEKEITDTETPTFEFGLDGRWFHIDLTAKEQEQVNKLLAPYVEKASEVEAKPVRRKAVAAAAGAKEDLDAIRAWATEKGHTVSPRGRIAQAIKDEYYSATGKTAPSK